MKRPTRLLLIILILSTLCVILPVAAAPIIINHTSTHLSEIPKSAINTAKSNLHIAYGHTSHGSQIITGMDKLRTFPNAPYGNTTYSFNNGGSGGALDLRDSPFSGADDLGSPDRTAWANATRDYLEANPEINVIIWSWCGQADTSDPGDITTYLNLMNGLEAEYPAVKFVYMTGHLVGTGKAGDLNKRNEQIRNYVRAHNKILYDFADIESFDPDGLTNYMLLNANDNCDYDSGNWAIEWQDSHVEGRDWYFCEPAHTQPLNGNLKAYAAWWLWARLGGWDGVPVPSSGSGIGVFRPSAESFYLKNGSTTTTIHNGDWLRTDIPLTGDWNRDGLGDVGVWRNSTKSFYLKNGTSNTVVNAGSWAWRTDIPVTGDWNGDSLGDVGVWRNSTNSFYLKNGTKITKVKAGSWSWKTDIPVTGDWNGDGLWDVGMWRNSTNSFYLKNGSGNTIVKSGSWSWKTDIPITGDWNGDGLWDVGVWRNSTITFHLKNGTRITKVNFGNKTDIPATGKWS